MFRHSHFRSALAILLAFSLVSASLWSYGTEATADLLSDEMAHFSATGHHAQPDYESIGKDGANKPCNHGCHAHFHLAGAECHDESFSPIPLQASALIPCGRGWSRTARTRISSGRLAASFNPESFPLT